MTAYTDYATYLKRYFDGKVQKLTINAGFTCPNRDGTKGLGGCSYCNNASFSPLPNAAPATPVSQQLEAGKRFFGRKYTDMSYLAYFQSYTNTYADLSTLMDMYHEALETPGIVGLIIGTRPDMMPDALLAELSTLARNHYISIEYGAETCHDVTLRRVNRCHTWADTVDAVTRTHDAGIHVGLHLIMGLPGESREMMLETARQVSMLPVDVIKLHQLQILKGTALAAKVQQTPTFTVDQYIDLCIDIISIIGTDIAIERFTSSAPDHLLLSPRWGLKNYQFTNLLNQRLSAK